MSAGREPELGRAAGRPRRGAKTLDRETIGRATIEVLSQHGAVELSISKIAQHLGVRSQTLYYHLSTIADAVNAARGVLFTGVSTDVFRELPWEDAVVEFAVSYYQALRPLGQGNSVFFLHEITDPETLTTYEIFLVRAQEAGVKGELAMQLLLDLEHSIFSLIFEQVSWSALFSPEAIEREGAHTLGALLRERDASEEMAIRRVRSTARALASATARPSVNGVDFS